MSRIKANIPLKWGRFVELGVQIVGRLAKTPISET